MTERRKLYYKIGEACRALDIQPYVLRYWETEFPVLAPNKSKSGQRVYAERELTVIRRIKELLYDEGYTIAGAKKKLETELSANPDDIVGAAPLAAREAKPPRAAAVAARPEDADHFIEKPEIPIEGAPAAPRKRLSPRPPAMRPEPRPANLSLPLGGPLDTHDTQRIETWRQGIEAALSEARHILAVLGTKHRS